MKNLKRIIALGISISSLCLTSGCKKVGMGVPMVSPNVLSEKPKPEPTATPVGCLSYNESYPNLDPEYPSAPVDTIAKVPAIDTIQTIREEPFVLCGNDPIFDKPGVPSKTNIYPPFIDKPGTPSETDNGPVKN